MRILIVEPWLDGSHRQWAEGYRQASSHQVDIVGLPGELWRWRLRGGALPLAALVTEWVRDHGPPHLLLVSGLVDVAQLLGLARSRLEATIAVVVYQHESQLADPSASSPDQEAALRRPAQPAVMEPLTNAIPGDVVGWSWTASGHPQRIAGGETIRAYHEKLQ